MKLPLTLVYNPALPSEIRDAEGQIVCVMQQRSTEMDNVARHIIFSCNEYHTVETMCENYRKMCEEANKAMDKLIESIQQGNAALFQSAQVALMGLRLTQACAPLILFVNKWEAKPIIGIDDILYSIHGGAANAEGIGADIRLSDLQRLKATLGQQPPSVEEVKVAARQAVAGT